MEAMNDIEDMEVDDGNEVRSSQHPPLLDGSLESLPSSSDVGSFAAETLDGYGEEEDCWRGREEEGEGNRSAQSGVGTGR